MKKKKDWNRNLDKTQIRLHIDFAVRHKMKQIALAYNYHNITDYDLDCLLLGHKIKSESLNNSQIVPVSGN